MKKATLIAAGYLSAWTGIYVVIVSLSSLWEDYNPLEGILIGSPYLIAIGIAVILGAITVQLFVKLDEVD